MGMTSQKDQRSITPLARWQQQQQQTSTTTGPAFGKIEYLKLHLNSPGRRTQRAISNFTVGLSGRAWNGVPVTRDASKCMTTLYFSIKMSN
jgi:hypothetical protein